MSGLVRSTQNLFHIGPKGPKNIGEMRRRMGENRRPYYGNVAGELLGQKDGRRKFNESLAAQGAVKRNGRYDKLPAASAQQLLGG